MKLVTGQTFPRRKDIKDLLHGNPQMGITKSTVVNAILLFVNENELYKDGFYTKDDTLYLRYTGIGRTGHQDSEENKTYYLNSAVLKHKEDGNSLLVFSKNKSGDYTFRGTFELTETIKEEQPDSKNSLRRVFVFHLKKVSDTFEDPNVL